MQNAKFNVTSRKKTFIIQFEELGVSTTHEMHDKKHKYEAIDKIFLFIMQQEELKDEFALESYELLRGLHYDHSEIVIFFLAKKLFDLISIK